MLNVWTVYIFLRINTLLVMRVHVFSRQVMSDSLWPHGLRHTRPACPSPSPGVCPCLYPLNQWCHPTISSTVALLSFCPQSFPVSGPFTVSWLFETGGQSIEASVSVLPMSWFPCCLRNSQRVFSSTTVQKHQLFSALCLLYGHVICKYFLLYSRLSFHFVNGFLCCVKTF